MYVYLLNIAMMIISYPLWMSFCKKGKKYFCIQSSLQWILVSGLRSVNVGADTGNYEFLFDVVGDLTWSDIGTIFSQFISGESIIKDPGYYAFIKFFQIFSRNYNVFLIFVAALFFIPMGIWIYRRSERPLLSYVIFSCLFYSFFAITGTRQTIVTGIGIFIGTELLKKKKYILFYFIILLLIPIHKSIAAFLIFPIISKIKISSLTLFFWMGLISCAWIFKGSLMSVVSTVFGYEEYDKLYEGAGVGLFTYLFMTLLIIGVFLIKITLGKHPEAAEGYNAMFMAATILPLVSINQSAMRGVQYFSIYLLLYVPWLISTVKKNQRKYLEFACIIVLVILLIQNNPRYSFFWQ